jgi:hypothetical protein
LVTRMVQNNSISLINGNGHIVPPLSPGPSSKMGIKEAGQSNLTRESSFDSDDGEDEEDDDGDDGMDNSTDGSVRQPSMKLEPSPSSFSTHLPATPLPHASAPISSSTPTSALVALATENASLKSRLAKLERVVQIILGMNQQESSGLGLDALGLLGPDSNAIVREDPNPAQPTANFFTPLINPNVMQGQTMLTTQASQPSALPFTSTFPSSSISPPRPNPSISTSNLFLPTDPQDHARHPAAMTIPSSKGTLQRACFSSPLLPKQSSLSGPGLVKSKEAMGRSDLEAKLMREKIGLGIKRVVEWRMRCGEEERGLPMVANQWGVV